MPYLRDYHVKTSRADSWAAGYNHTNKIQNTTFTIGGEQWTIFLFGCSSSLALQWQRLPGSRGGRRDPKVSGDGVASGGGRPAQLNRHLLRSLQPYLSQQLARHSRRGGVLIGVDVGALRKQRQQNDF
jgi:hypothetical protein